MTRLIIAFSYMGTSLRFAFTWEQPHRAKFRTVRLNVAFNYVGGKKEKKKKADCDTWLSCGVFVTWRQACLWCFVATRLIMVTVNEVTVDNILACGVFVTWHTSLRT